MWGSVSPLISVTALLRNEAVHRLALVRQLSTASDEQHKWKPAYLE